jgi:hypothetical protein
VDGWKEESRKARKRGKRKEGIKATKRGINFDHGDMTAVLAPVTLRLSLLWAEGLQKIRHVLNGVVFRSMKQMNEITRQMKQKFSVSLVLLFNVSKFVAFFKFIIKTFKAPHEICNVLLTNS